MDAELEAKLREIVDRHEIWTLLLRFARGLDRLDREMVRSIYWDDAIEDHYNYIGTPDGFIDWAMANTRQTNSVQHHGLSNHFCEIDGDDAHSETYFSYIAENLAPPHQLCIGRYADHFQRRQGVWKIANRVTMIDKSFALDSSPGDELRMLESVTCGPLLPSTRDRNDFSYQRPLRPRQPPKAD